jgi:uncharacterized protein
VAHPKSQAMISAAISGKADKIRQFLSEGVPIESQDMNRSTPVMLAAAHGHVEAFQVLVEAGADLHAVAARQKDLLEHAVDSGKAELVRFLLDRGLPVDGHWKPPASENPAVRKIGHDTPLLRAAEGGAVEIVRILLEAGADRSRTYNGRTALDVAKEHLHDPDHEEHHEAYREIVALLGGAPATSGRSLDSIKEEVAKFAENACRPEYAKLCDSLTAKCGPGRPWTPVPDHGIPATNVVMFTLTMVKRQNAIEKLQAEARDADCQLALAEAWSPGEDAELVLFPTSDKLAVVAAVGTEGANSGVKNIPHVIDWLQRLDSENPFHLCVCTHDAVGGVFVSPVKGAKKLAERIVNFCPSSVVEGANDAKALATVLKNRRSFYLWWD